MCIVDCEPLCMLTICSFSSCHIFRFSFFFFLGKWNLICAIAAHTHTFDMVNKNMHPIHKHRTNRLFRIAVFYIYVCTAKRCDFNVHFLEKLFAQHSIQNLQCKPYLELGAHQKAHTITQTHFTHIHTAKEKERERDTHKKHSPRTERKSLAMIRLIY